MFGTYTQGRVLSICMELVHKREYRKFQNALLPSTMESFPSFTIFILMVPLNSPISFKGGEQIPSRAVGYVLRILGQNPTEDEIVEMVMKVDSSVEN